MKQRPFLALWTLAVAATVAAFVLHLALRGRTVDLGYKLGRTRAEQARLREVKRVLSLEAASYQTPQRVENVARTLLGMTPPPPERVIPLKAPVPTMPPDEQQRMGEQSSDIAAVMKAAASASASAGAAPSASAPASSRPSGAAPRPPSHGANGGKVRMAVGLASDDPYADTAALGATAGAAIGAAAAAAAAAATAAATGTANGQGMASGPTAGVEAQR